MLNRRGYTNKKVPAIFFKFKLKNKPLSNLSQVKATISLIILVTDLNSFFSHVQ